MTWKHSSSPPVKKFKGQQSGRELMATAFWDAKDVLYGNFSIPGKKALMPCANYCEPLDKSREVVQRNRPGLFIQGVFFFCMIMNTPCSCFDKRLVSVIWMRNITPLCSKSWPGSISFSSLWNPQKFVTDEALICEEHACWRSLSDSSTEGA